MHVIFFVNDTATTEIYPYGHTLSLHDALPIFHTDGGSVTRALDRWRRAMGRPIYFVDFAADTARIAHDPGIRLAEAAYWLRFEALASRAVPQIGRASCRERVCQYG